MAEEKEKSIETDDNSTKNNDKRYIMFVCKKCGALCLTLPDYFVDINPGDVIESRLSQKMSLTLVHDFLDEESNDSTEKDINYINSNIYQKGLANFLNLSKSPFFPWCLQCILELKDRVQNRVKYIKTAETFYSQLDIPQKSIFQEILEEEVDKLNDETTQIKKNGDIKDPFYKQLNFSSQSLLIDSDSLIQSEDETMAQHCLGNPNSVYFKSLVLPITFHIGVSGTFGTINTLRLGQNKNWSISNDELDMSLFFLAQIVKSAGRLANVDVSSIQISTDVKIRLKTDFSEDDEKNSEKKKDFFSKLQQTLFGKGSDDDIIILKASDMKKAKTIPRFNQALDVIFRLSSEIFESQNIQQDSMMAPNLISPEDHTIADSSYYFDSKDPYLWSHNMRLLLFNYAFLFTSCLRNAVVSIE